MLHFGYGGLVNVTEAPRGGWQVGGWAPRAGGTPLPPPLGTWGLRVCPHPLGLKGGGGWGVGECPNPPTSIPLRPPVGR